MPKVKLTHNCHLPGCEGGIGDVVEVSEENAAKLTRLGGADMVPESTQVTERVTKEETPSAAPDWLKSYVKELVDSQAKPLIAENAKLNAKVDSLSSDLESSREQLQLAYDRIDTLEQLVSDTDPEEDVEPKAPKKTASKKTAK